MTINWGILATGSIAHTFADAADKSAHNKLVAVASRQASKAEAFCSDHAGTTPHGSYQSLVDDGSVDAIYIANPHTGHAEWTIKALNAGKHVLCEKPMGLNHAQVMAMVDAAGQNQRFLMEAFMYRCHPQTAKLLELIGDGAIGEVRHIRCYFGFHAPFRAESRLFANDLAGGGIMDVGCYPLSMTRLITGGEPSIKGHGRLGETGVDEWAAALLSFDGGVSAQIACAVSLSLDNQLIIYGSEGHIRVTNPWGGSDGEGNWQFHLRLNGKDAEIISGHADALYVLEIDHVARKINQGALQSENMSWEDSANNGLALDAWRREVGVSYDCERPENHIGPLVGSLETPSEVLQPGTIRHLQKPVSRLVMGCDNQPGMSHAAVMWDNYFQLGGNCFDTAHIYGGGRMESLLGHWHTRRELREDIVIIGKGAHTPDNRPECVAPQLDISLERLQTDHVDVYFLHRDNEDLPVGEFVDALNDELRRGRIKAFGGSNWRLERIVEANAYAADNGLQGFSAVSNNFSLAHMVTPIWPGVESATSDAFRTFLSESGIALMPWSSQARGFFTPWAGEVITQAGKRENLNITNMQPTVVELQKTWFSESNFERRKRAGELADQKGTSMIAIALAYVINQPFACFPLIGPRQISETRSSFAASQITLTQEELVWLDVR